MRIPKIKRSDLENLFFRQKKPITLNRVIGFSHHESKKS